MKLRHYAGYAIAFLLLVVLAVSYRGVYSTHKATDGIVYVVNRYTGHVKVVAPDNYLHQFSKVNEDRR